MQQFGIDVSILEKVTLDEAKNIFEDYIYNTRNQIIKNYLGLQGESTFIAMTEAMKEEKLGEIIKAIKEGRFVVTPEMLGLKKKSFLKRFFESRKNKNILDAPKTDFTEGAGLKQSKPTGDENFVPRAQISTQPQISAIPKETIGNDGKEVAE